MDIVTAKTLVSALLVFCIAAFSLVSFHALFAEVSRDLRTAWARRARVAASRQAD